MTARIFTVPFEDTLKGLLWGYPSLFDEFHEKVKPELDAARRRRNRNRRQTSPHAMTGYHSETMILHTKGL